MLLRHFLSNPQAIGNVLNICEKSTSGQQSSLANFWRGEMLKEEIFWSCTLIKPEIHFYTKVSPCERTFLQGPVDVLVR